MAVREADAAHAMAAGEERAPEPLTLCFGVHDHQPAANFESVLEEASDRAYLPFLEAAARHPRFRFSLHVSGGLLAWLERRRPAGVERIGEMVERGQVELMGGGFYEPILPAVPERDALGQMELLSDHLERRFGSRPRGAWLAERVWEGRMAALLAGAGFRYTVLDDHHFLRAGLPSRDLRGYFVTEREGRALNLFPILKKLRYVLPFRPVDGVLDALRELARVPGGASCVTYADDGEKFGLWPGTSGWVYGKRWLEGFLEALERESAWLATAPFADALARFPPSGRTYLPDSSYVEMTEWALPTEARTRLAAARARLEEEGLDRLVEPFLAGGHWPEFLAKYPEGNLMHKKMIWVSEALEAGRVADGGVAPEPARARLYRAQSNCAYWHGVFGGLYLGHLRNAVFADLLEAEAQVAPVRAPTVERLDFDRDGLLEVWVRTPEVNLLVAPARGGGIPLLEIREARMNLTNVLTRRPEAYHEEIREAALTAEAAGAAEPASARASTAEAAGTRGEHGAGEMDEVGEAPLRREASGAPGTDRSSLEAADSGGPLRPRETDGAAVPAPAADDGDAVPGPAAGGGEPATIHERLSVTPELARALVYDPHDRLSALDHLLAPDVTLEAFRGSGSSAGRRPLPAYELLEASAREGGARIVLERGPRPRVRKELELARGGALRAAWSVRGASAPDWFLAEWNLFFFWDRDPGRRYVIEGEPGPTLGATLDLEGVRSVGLDDRPMGLSAWLSSGRPFRLWAFPLQSVSRGEKGYETAYQGTCLALGWPLSGAPEERFSVELAWRRG